MAEEDTGTVDKLPIVRREDWGALPAKRVRPLGHPVQWICLSYNNEISEHNKSLMREIQESHMNSDMWDIQSNFLVSTDGTIYEGRGWYAQPAKLFGEYAKYNGKFIDITIIGKYEGIPDLMDPSMEGMVKWLEFAVNSNYVSRKFQFVEQGETPLSYCYQTTEPDLLN